MRTCRKAAVFAKISQMPQIVMKDRKSLFRQFLAGMYDSVVITDPNGHIIETNPRAEEHFERTAEEMSDRQISVLIPGLKSEIVQRVRRGIDDGRHMMIDANGVNKSGKPFACEIAVSRLDLKEPGDLVFTIRNIERRRRIREMLRARECAFDISQTALFVCSSEGAITDANDSFLEMFSLAGIEEARKTAFADLMPDEPLVAAFKRALGGEKSTIAITAEKSDSESGQTNVELSLAPVRDGRKVKGVAGSILAL